MSNNTYNFRELMDEEIRLLNRESEEGNMQYVNAVAGRELWGWPDKYRQAVLDHAENLLQEFK